MLNDPRVVPNEVDSFSLPEGLPGVPKATPPNAPPPIIIPELKRLAIENTELRLVHYTDQKLMFEARVADLEVVIARLSALFNAELEKLGNEYGFDPSTSVMEQGTGLIKERK